MTPEKIIDSLQQAKVFFRKYFNRDIRMFCCSSWILNPDWETELPDSNMAFFIRLGWAVPAIPWDKAGLFFVFGTDEVDFETVPESNSLYRAFRNLNRQGRKLRPGSTFFMAEDLDKLHENYYREEGSAIC